MRARASRRSWFLASLVLLLAAATPATAGDILGDDAPLSLRDRLARHRRLAAEPELVLAPGGGDDGYLRAAEIYPLALHAQLVVLSACRSGAGRLAGGEGLLSLERAFLYAGARAVVATMWEVGYRGSLDARVAGLSPRRPPARWPKLAAGALLLVALLCGARALALRSRSRL